MMLVVDSARVCTRSVCEESLTAVNWRAALDRICRGWDRLLVADSCLMAVAKRFRDWPADFRNVPADWVTAWMVSV